MLWEAVAGSCGFDDSRLEYPPLPTCLAPTGDRVAFHRAFDADADGWPSTARARLEEFRVARISRVVRVGIAHLILRVYVVVVNRGFETAVFADDSLVV